MKIRPVAAELYRAEGQTDVTKLIVAFRNVANEPKIIYKINKIWIPEAWHPRAVESFSVAALTYAPGEISRSI